MTNSRLPLAGLPPMHRGRLQAPRNPAPPPTPCPRTPTLVEWPASLRVSSAAYLASLAAACRVVILVSGGGEQKSTLGGGGGGERRSPRQVVQGNGLHIMPAQLLQTAAAYARLNLHDPPTYPPPSSASTHTRTHTAHTHSGRGSRPPPAHLDGVALVLRRVLHGVLGLLEPALTGQAEQRRGGGAREVRRAVSASRQGQARSTAACCWFAHCVESCAAPGPGPLAGLPGHGRAAPLLQRRPHHLHLASVPSRVQSHLVPVHTACLPPPALHRT